MSRKTKLRSVRNSKDFITRTVMTTDVFGRARFVSVSSKPDIAAGRQLTRSPPPTPLVTTRSLRGYEMNGTAESPLTLLTQRPPPSTLTTLPQILSALSSLESEEAELSNSLSALLTDQEPILNSLARLQSLLPHVDELYTEASMLSSRVSATARTAERVGGRVRTLDEEMRRVREASDRVQQVMELKVVIVLSTRCALFSFLLLTLLVILGSAPVIHRRAGLGVGDAALRAGYGPP